MIHSRFLPVSLATLAPAADGQDRSDSTVPRTIERAFHDAYCWTLLVQNHRAQAEILAYLTSEGAVSPDVGVRVRELRREGP